MREGKPLAETPGQPEPLSIFILKLDGWTNGVQCNDSLGEAIKLLSSRLSWCLHISEDEDTPSGHRWAPLGRRLW